MTTLTRPTFRLNGSLSRIPALARLSVGLIWLAVALLASSPVTGTLLVLAASGILLVGTGLPAGRLWRVVGPAAALILALGVLTLLLQPSPTAPSAVLAAVHVVIVLALSLAVALAVLAPQDPEVIVDELVGILHVPPRRAFGVLLLAHVVGALPADWSAQRVARRARGVQARGFAGSVVERVAVARWVIGAARRRLHRLSTAVRLSALGAGPEPVTVQQARVPLDTWLFVAGGAIVAFVALLIGSL